MRKEAVRQACVVGAAVVVFFTLLGRPYLWDEDEPKNAECTREMFEAGNWVVPQFNYALRTDKPILLYWLMLTAYHVFGVTEFAARFWSAALGVGTVWLTYGIGRRLYRPDVGLWSALALATCVLFAVASRGATPDATLVFCTTLALYLFVRSGGAHDGRFTLGNAAPVYAATGLAVLAKGPVGVLLPTCAFGLFLLCRAQQQSDNNSPAGPWYRRWFVKIAQTIAPRRFFAAAWTLRPLTLLVIVGAVALPWYVLVGLRTDGAWLAGFLGKHNVARFTGAMEGHSGSIIYHPIVIMVGFFPWSCFLPIGVYKLVLRLHAGATNEHRASDTLLACWAGLYIAFFSLSATKLPGYVLPCYPALAVITGKLIADYVASPSAVPRLWFRWALYSPAIAGAAICIGLPIAAAYFLPGDQWLGVVGASLVVGSAVLIYLANRARPVWVPTAFAVMSLVFITSLVAGAASIVSRRTTSPIMARAAQVHAGVDTSLIGFRHFEPTLPFYSRGEVPTAHTADQLQALLRAKPGACIVTRDEFLPDLRAALDVEPEIVARQRRFLRRHGDVVLVVPRSPAILTSQNQTTLQR